MEEFPTSSVKDIAYFYCQKMGIEYNDSIRSRISKLKSSSKDFINTSDTDTNQYTAPVSTLSALKEDGTIMTIEEYCGHYGIDKTSVRSFKLVTHTGKGAYYNIASKSIEADHSTSFTKRLLEDLGKLPNLPTSLKREKNGTRIKSAKTKNIIRPEQSRNKKNRKKLKSQNERHPQTREERTQH